MTASKPFFRHGSSIIIYNDDSLALDAIEPGSVNLTVTSPPYDVDIRYEGYRDNIPYSECLKFTERWLEKCYQLSRPDGRLCLNIPLDKLKGGGQSVYADIVQIAKKVG